MPDSSEEFEAVTGRHDEAHLDVGTLDFNFGVNAIEFVIGSSKAEDAAGNRKVLAEPVFATNGVSEGIAVEFVITVPVLDLACAYAKIDSKTAVSTPNQRWIERTCSP